MGRLVLLAMLVGCAREGAVGEGPSVGGNLDLDDPLATEASFLAEHGAGLASQSCDGEFCIDAVPSWHLDADDALRLVATVGMES
jgi:hypothetical protein